MMNKIVLTLAVLTLTASGCVKGCKKEEASMDAAAPTTESTATNPSNAQSSPAAEPKVEMEDLVVGKGTEAVSGKTITVHYTGTLKDGTKFDSSVDRKEPFTFSLGAGQVIKGWDQGVAGMKVGGKRKLTIPPELGYGANTVGAIPANSTLIFEVELLEVK